MTAMILKYPEDGKIYEWARSYAHIFSMQGQVAAGRFARDNIPQQFHKQIDPLVKKYHAEIIGERKK